MSVNNGTSDQSSKYKNSKFKQKFKQQRLPAWQPILTADTVLPAFFLIGLLFVPLGVALLLFSNGVVEYEYDYTDCTTTDEKYMTPIGDFQSCKTVIAGNFTPGVNFCFCHLKLNITEPMEGPVYMYYGLDNFYQNHRRYVKSRDDKQLAGKVITDVSTDCSPFDKAAGGLNYAPCGAIANSLFNDTLELFKDDVKVPLRGDNIAWDSDRNIKFSNPPGPLNAEEGGAFEGTTKPKSWTRPVYMLGAPPNNTGYENEDLIVWMRTAAFPSFRKLYRRVDEAYLEQEASKSLKGLYTVTVEYNYPVDSFGGKKRVILSTTSFLGGKNNFLGIAYITVGCICFLLGVIFLVIHVKFGERTTNHLNINQNTPYTK